jgi:hypothetical protein
VLGFEQERGTLGSALHGAGWPTMLMAVLYGIISVAFSVWFTAIIRARWSGSGSLRVRAGKASYATYFLHPLVLTAIMVLFGTLPAAPELKLLIVAVLAVPVCFLAGDAATRLLGISGRAAWLRPKKYRLVVTRLFLRSEADVAHPGPLRAGRPARLGHLGVRRRSDATDDLLGHPVQERQCAGHDAANAIDVRNTWIYHLRVAIDRADEVR